MWYKNQTNRIQFVKNIPQLELSKEEIKRSLQNIFIAIYQKENNMHRYKCTYCNKKTKYKKRQYLFICNCGMLYTHNLIKTDRLKNYEGRQVICKTNYVLEKKGCYNTLDYYFYYWKYDYVRQTIKADKPLLIARDLYVEENSKGYHYNLGYGMTTNSGVYLRFHKKYKHKISEKSGSYLNVNFDLDETNNDFLVNIKDYKYIDKTDKYLKILHVYFIKKSYSIYCVELFQKYNSLYIWSNYDIQISNKIVNMLDLQNYMSKLQAVKLLQLHAKSKSLDINIYKDYLIMSKQLNGKLTESDLFRLDYKELHDIIQKQLSIKNNAIKNIKLERIYSTDENFEYKNLHLVIPRNCDDFIYEGDELNHCIKNYINRVINRECKILFIREKKDIPFITVELKNNEITQMRGLNNTNDFIKQKHRNIVKKYIKQQEAK